ncbi:MAG: amidohydrolase family protein [Acidobacteria bacterium]|nr:amidohydrolase family protein [Acidobacteriota bacterium]
MGRTLRLPRIPLFVLLLLLCICQVRVTRTGAASEASLWRADHHVHLASPELCRLVGECLESNHPPAVYAADAIRALDQARVAKGVVLSCAYLYGLPSLHRTPREVAELTRRENEFTAAQVAQFPGRLVGFFSVNPLQRSALAEIRHWRGSKQLVGLKLHFTASAVDIRNAAERRQVAKVVASTAHMPIVLHIDGGKFNADDAELFIREVLPAAKDSWVQIAHAGGGLPEEDGNHLKVLRVFADHIAHDDPATRHVLFDVSYVPGPEDSASTAAAFAEQMRRIGMKRFLFGSDFNVLTPQQEIDNLRKLGLTEEEWKTLQENCAPWACVAP